jgi:hypothetical protein
MEARGGSEETVPPPEPPVMPVLEAVAAVPVEPPDEGFRLTVEDVFSIAGRGTVVTGVVERGTLRVGEALVLKKPDGRSLPTVCTGIEAFRRILDEARPGDNIGILLRRLGKDDVARGDRVVAATSAEPSGDPGPSPLTRILTDRGLPPAPTEVEREIGSLVGSRQVIEAIKVLREQYPSLGLAEAKGVIDELRGGTPAQGKSGGCFIATAACGSPEAPAVVALRDFRERALRPTRLGRGLIRGYERLSPSLAGALARVGLLRALVRYAIVRPAARLAEAWLRRHG